MSCTTKKRKESIQIFSIKLQSPIEAKDFRVEDYVSYYHEQECCEHVYIDFDHVEKQRDEINAMGYVQSIELMTAPEEWVIVNLYGWIIEGTYGAQCKTSIFLACRNVQNGFYNDDLSILFKIDGLEITTSLRELWCIVDVMED